LLEPADVFTGQPPEARPDRLSNGLATGFEILAVEDGQALGIQGFHHLPEGPFRRKAILQHQIAELTVDDLEQQGPFAETRREGFQLGLGSGRQAGTQQPDRLRDLHRIYMDLRRVRWQRPAVASRHEKRGQARAMCSTAGLSALAWLRKTS